VAQHVAVVTDSSACLPPEVAAAWGIGVVPLQVVIDGEARAEGDAGLSEDVVRALAAGVRATTSQPSLGTCVEALERAARGADAVVVVTLPESMSGTAGVLARAAQGIGTPVTVVDSRTVALGTGFAALSAAAAARSGADAEAVAREAARVARSALTLFTVEKLDHLRRGGRVAPAVATVGNALNIRPVLGVVHGEVAVVDRVRTAAKARAAMLSRIASRAPALRSGVIGLMRLPGDEELEREARAVLARRGTWPVLSTELSAVLAVHSGPGTLATVVADVHPAVREALVAT